MPTPALLTADRITNPRRIILGSIPYPSGGDLGYGKGLAARVVGSDLYVYCCSWNPQTWLEFRVPSSLSGTATYTRNLGTLPFTPGAQVHGGFWDGDYFYQSSHSVYDTNIGTGRTLSRGYLNTAGTFVVDTDATGARDFWQFSNRSDKMTMGGVTHVPAWFRTAAGLPSTYTLAAGYGGYYSIVATGPASMGPSLTAFAPPPVGSGLTAIANTPLQGYPYGVSPVPRQHRPTNYVNEFGEGFPTNPTSTGYWTWVDQIWGAGCWVDTDAYSGFVTLAVEGTGCCFYGHNDGTLSPCANTPGTPATINSSGTQLVWNITNPTDLIAVAQGAAQNSIQSAFTIANFGSFVTNHLGSPQLYAACTGMTFVPELSIILAEIRFPTSQSARPIIIALDVPGTATPPPTPSPLVITTSTLPAGEIFKQYTGTTLTATGGVPGYTWTQTGGPAGMTLSTGGVLSGTPTVSGSFTLATTVTDTQPVQTNKNLALTIAQPTIPTLTLTTTNFGSTEEDKAFTATAHATGGVPPYTWTFANLPTGLSGNTSTGVISGTPTTPGSYTVDVTVTDTRPVSVGPTGVPLTVTATPSPPPTPAPVITTTSLPNGTVGTLYQQQLAATSTATPLRWACSNTPDGLVVSTTGLISGQPTTQGTTLLAITVTDTLNQTTPGTLSLTIDRADPPVPSDLAVTTASLAAGVVGATYSQALTATGGTGPYFWACDNLPAEFVLTSAGVLQGTPSVAISIVLTISVTDSQTVPDRSGVELALVVTGPAPDPGTLPPDMPQVYLPLDGATKVKRVTTNGNCVRFWGVANADGYQVYHGTSTTPPLIATISQSDPAYVADYPAGSYVVPVSRGARTDYYWRIVAFNGAGVTSTKTFRYKTK